MKRALVLSVMIALVGGVQSFGSISPAVAKAAKQWTITDRQVALRKRVEAGIKSKELTAKEGEKLNGNLTDISDDIEKMKSKNGGKLSYKDEGKIEKRLNSVSLKIDKYSLAKRVQAH